MGIGRGGEVRRAIIIGAAGRDFHNFNVVFRDNPAYKIVAFTAAQIPGIADRTYPPALAGNRYPNGIPILPEQDLEASIRRLRVNEAFFSYSDVSHEDVMHLASRVLAAGASFTFLGPADTMLTSALPVIAVCAVRTGAGKSPTTQHIARWFKERGHRVSVLRHPMPYGDLERQAVQRFATMKDLDNAEATIEEREEYEPYLRMGVPIFAGVDYARILAMAELEAEVVLWDGGNNDFPFIRPDLLLVVVDPHRLGHETAYHPGEANFRMADAYVISKANSASRSDVAELRKRIRALKPRAPIVVADLALTVDKPDLLQGRRVVVVGDGPTLTHGGMTFGAGTLVARECGAKIVDPRPYAVGALGATLEAFPEVQEIPAMGYSSAQVSELGETLQNSEADVVIDATPVDLSLLLKVDKPIVSVDYELQERGRVLEDLLERFTAKHLSKA